MAVGLVTGLAGTGDAVVMVAASPVGWAKTNMLKVHRLEE